MTGSLQDEAWLRSLTLLEKHGLSWDLRVPYWHLAEAAEVAAAFPRLAIVLNHTGLPWDRSAEGLAAWRRGMEALAAQPNVQVKVSELGVPGAPWTVAGNRGVVRDTLAIFGIERCMFASNAPVSGLRAGFDTIVRGLEAILDDLTAHQREAFFWRNAARFYRIELDRE
jgi:predicted TIM-barrel fold metal-dependent hydrolase